MESVPADQRGDVSKSVVLIENVLTYNDTEGVLPEVETANAYRAIIGSGVKGEIVDEAEATLGPAENYGGRLSFRFLVPLGIFVTLIFALIYRNDKRRGGYQSQVDKEAAEMRPA